MIARRNLLAGIIAAGIAPAVARSGVLMPVRGILLPKPYDWSGHYSDVLARPASEADRRYWAAQEWDQLTWKGPAC